MKRLGRDAAELTTLADHLTVHGLVLEMLAGPLPGIYDSTGPGRILFGFFAAMAETDAAVAGMMGCRWETYELGGAGDAGRGEA